MSTVVPHRFDLGRVLLDLGVARDDKPAESRDLGNPDRVLDCGAGDRARLALLLEHHSPTIAGVGRIGP
ncbi:MAG: hypothetical protein WCF33_20695 [Pseudonocardiaceae bacterium]